MLHGPAWKASGQAVAFAIASLATFGAASAQNVASGPQADPCARYRMDDPSRAQCAYNESVRRTKEHERRGAAADVRADAARDETAQLQRRTACNGELQNAIKGRPERIEKVRGFLGGRSIREADPCELLEQLKRG